MNTENLNLYSFFVFVALHHDSARCSRLDMSAISADAPYKIRKIPKQIYVKESGYIYKSLTYLAEDLLARYTHRYRRGELEEFTSWFDSYFGCIFGMYYRLDIYDTLSKGFLCLLCGEFSLKKASIHKDNYTPHLSGHILDKHHFLAPTPVLTNSQAAGDVGNFIYCDFRQYCDGYKECEFAQDGDFIDEKIKNNANCYLCALCGLRYGVAPSQEVVVSHIKKCIYVKDCANTDLSEYKVPANIKPKPRRIQKI